MDRRREFALLGVILLVAFGLRLGAAISLQWALDHRLNRTYLIPGDAEGYWELAEDLAAGREYSIYTPPRRVLRMPGFPGLLAASIAAFGDSRFAARVLLCVVGAAGCAAVHWLGRSLFDARIGLLAGGIAAVLPTFVGLSPLILSETAFAACLAASLAAAAGLFRTLRSPAPSWLGALASGVLCGALIGVANLMRPSWLLAAPGIGLMALLCARGTAKGWGAAGGVVLATFLMLLPWGLRNQRATGHFVLTTLWMGPSLYDGLSPEATGDSDMTFFDRENLLGRMSEYEVDREYRARAWAFARAEPPRALELGLIKLGRFWRPWPNAEQFGSVWARLAVAASSVPLWLLAAYGAWRLRPHWTALALTVGPLAYFSAVHMLFVGSIRYRIPAEYPLAALAAAGAAALLDRWRGRSAEGGASA
ncbi:MAG: glycosyltransferase family 39 protein [Planctomyces sp.]|nr:glycosyltransferase family 39 protein [Planctomyces sp.]